MDYTLFEINKHKININTFSNKLMNTFNINEEIAINNEIKKEVEILITLLNIKMNFLSNQMLINNNMNFNMNNNINALNPMMANQDFININPFQQQQQIIPQDIRKEEKMENIINIQFERIGEIGDNRIIIVYSKYSEKVYDLIQKYRVKANDWNLNEGFFYNDKKINPDLTLAEAGLCNNCIIKVVTFGILKAGFMYFKKNDNFIENKEKGVIFHNYY